MLTRRKNQTKLVPNGNGTVTVVCGAMGQNSQFPERLPSNRDQ